jgi:MFS family permease
MPTPVSARAAERWFLDNGLPSVLTRRARWRGLWPRSAPVLAGFAALMVVGLVIYLLVGNIDVDIDGPPTGVESIVLAVLALTVPFVVITGWLAARLRGHRARCVASTASAAVAVVSDALIGDATDVAGTALGVVAVPLLTATGLGSVLGWALKLAVSQLAAVGQLMLRALPVVLLTVLVFFNSPVWLMAASVGRGRLWLALLFLGIIAAVFLITSTLERVRPMLAAPSPREDEPLAQKAEDNRQADELADTPFAKMADPAASYPLTRRERFNVVFVLIATQLVQVLTVAVVTTLIFFVLGLILLNRPLLAAWTRTGSTDGQLLWMTIPVPNALIQVTLFLGALTFMYLTARAVGDLEYRSQFLDPLIDDLRLTLVARNRYRAATADA